MTSKAERLRNKRRAKLDLPELAKVGNPRKLQGRARMAQIEADPEARHTVLDARARMMGLDPATSREEMARQAYGEAAGRAIRSFCDPDSAARLWRVYTGLTQANDRYHRMVLGVSMHPKVAKIETEPERFGTRADDQVDLRSEDERHRDAVNAWTRWHGYLMHLSAHEQTAIWDVVKGRIEPMTPEGITPRGIRFVEALQKVSEVVDQQGGIA